MAQVASVSTAPAPAGVAHALARWGAGELAPPPPPSSLLPVGFWGSTRLLTRQQPRAQNCCFSGLTTGPDTAFSSTMERLTD